MKLRTILVAGGLLLAAAWWLPGLRSDPSADIHADAGATTVAGCPLPPGVAGNVPPLQTPVPGSMRPFASKPFTLTPLAGFSVQARVLSRRDYDSDSEARLSPTDLALGWQRMADDDVLSQLSISQSSRWYRYSWKGQPPMEPGAIARSSANMHMVPANDAVAKALASIRKDDSVRIDGWLIEARNEQGWHWRSSLTREDTGGGACELVYVCSVSRL